MWKNRKHPLISVIVPAFNAAAYLSEALQSIENQTYPHLETIVIDDGSTDQTRLIAEQHRSSYFYQTHQGVAEARNLGIRKATGAYVSFLDADDCYLPSKILSQWEYLEQHPDCDIVLCQIQRTDEKLLPLLSPGFATSFSTAMIRKAIFEQVGLCDSFFIHCEDLDWVLRAKDCGIAIAYQTEIGVLYRQHPHNMTRDQQMNRHYFHRAMQQSIQRKRCAIQSV